MKNIKASYDSLLAKFAQKGKKGESVNSDVRFAPVDGNQNRGDHELRELLHSFSRDAAVERNGRLYIGR